MKVLDDIKRVMESIENKKSKNEDACCSSLFEKYNDIPEERLQSIIDDVKASITKEECGDIDNKEDVMKKEADNSVDVEGDLPAPEPDDVEHTDALKAMNELSASESEEDDATTEDEVEEQVVSEDEEYKDDIDDDLIISEEADEEGETADDIVEDSEDFDVYKDELDLVEKDEDAEDIDMSIPEKENSNDAADTAVKEPVNEANTGAKAAVANTYDGKNSFSSDIDALTDYLNDY